MTALWDQLNSDPRQKLRYPSEHVVRWLAGMPGHYWEPGLDIGCGYGRHMSVMDEFGYVPYGVDASPVSSWRRVIRGDMVALPFPDDEFHVALAFGVFYYGTHQDHLQAIFELYRVLKPGGKALVVTRTFRDSRAKSGEWVDIHTERMTEGDEAGMLINFMAEEDIDVSYGMFSEVGYELTETTRNNRGWRDSDWLIQVTK